jgi:hypothetical protein
VPDSEIDWGLFSALSVIFTLPVLFPFAVGLNVTLIAQLAPAAIVPLLLQVVPLPLTIAKLPLSVRVPRVSGVFPVFVNVTVLAALVVPTFCVAKLRLLALKLACGLMTVRLRGINCGLPAALSVIAMVAVEAVGLKIFAEAKKPTAIVQVFPASNVPGIDGINGKQIVISAKSPSALPGVVIFMLEILIGVVPVLVKVTNWAPT